MSRSNPASFEEMDQSVDLDLDHNGNALDDDVQQSSSKAGKQRAAPTKKPFPLAPALAAVFVVVGGAMGWQWWSQHHHAPSSPPVQTGGGMGLLEHPLPQQHGVQQTGLMAVDNAPPHAAVPMQGVVSPAAPTAALAPAAAPSSPISAALPAMASAVAPPGRIPPQPSRPVVSAAVPTAAVQTKQESLTQSSPPVQQAETANRSDTAALSMRIDAIDKEIRGIASRLSVIQSEMKPRQAPAAAPTAAPEPALPRASARIVAVNGDTAVVAIEGQFHKVSIGASIPGFGRVIRMGPTGIQTSAGGWIKR